MFFRLRGCWPKNKPQFAVSYDKDGALHIEMTMVVDKIDTQMLIGSVVNKVISTVTKAVVSAVGGKFRQDKTSNNSN